jgi:hypothetical protein
MPRRTRSDCWPPRARCSPSRVWVDAADRPVCQVCEPALRRHFATREGLIAEAFDDEVVMYAEAAEVGHRTQPVQTEASR